MDKRKLKKGEEGYYERDTKQAHLENRTFKTVEELQKVIEDYFAECDAKHVLYSESGLCVYLSRHNSKHKTVSSEVLRLWHDGKRMEEFQDTVQLAYLRIREQIETDERYQEKAMVNRCNFLNGQARLGGYNKEREANNELTINVKMGKNVTESDCK